MNRKTSMVVSLLVSLATLSFGQVPQNETGYRTPENVLAPQQLIAWSHLQKPRPVPQPLPPPDTPIPQPGSQQADPANPAAPQQAPTQTFTGRIVKDGSNYVLKVSRDTTYQLDKQSGASRYEDKDVRVVGSLDTVSNTIHVVRIDLLS